MQINNYIYFIFNCFIKLATRLKKKKNQKILTSFVRVKHLIDTR